MEKLELDFVNVDHLLHQILMIYDEENGTSIIELVLKKMGNPKQDPEAMFIEDRLIEISSESLLKALFQICRIFPQFKIGRDH